MKEPLCPWCGSVPQSMRQESPRAHLCKWCGYNYDTGEVPTLSTSESQADRRAEEEFWGD